MAPTPQRSITSRSSRQQRRFRNSSGQLALAGLAGTDARVELLRLSARHGERLPLWMVQVLGQQHNLSAVIGVVGKLAVDGLHDRMRLAADGHGARQIIVGERLKRGKQM